MFSSRVPGDLSPNPLAAAVERMRLSGRGFDDLTASNPTDAGFEYPADLFAPLASAEALHYDPKPFGLLAAREAVAADYARRGVKVAAPTRRADGEQQRELRTALQAALRSRRFGARPTPSYPLFEHLTRLDSVQARPYGTRVPRHVGDRSRGPEGRDRRHHARRFWS